MRLKLQRYYLIVTYRPGKEILLADALSRAYLPNKEAVNSIELPETMSRLAISTERKTRFIKETKIKYSNNLNAKHNTICQKKIK